MTPNGQRSPAAAHDARGRLVQRMLCGQRSGFNRSPKDQSPDVPLKYFTDHVSLLRLPLATLEEFDLEEFSGSKPKPLSDQEPTVPILARKL